MKLLKKDRARLARQASRLRTLIFRDGILAGTLTNMVVGDSKRTTFTDKKDNKTRCLYVPQWALPKAERLVKNWKEVREILREMSAFWREEMVDWVSSSRTCTSKTAAAQDVPRKRTPAKKRSLKH